MVQAQGTLTKGDVTKLEGRYVEMKSWSDDTTPVRTKTGRGDIGLVREVQSIQISLPLGRIKAGHRTTVGFKSTHHPDAQHGIHMDRRQPKQSGQQLIAADVA